MTQSRKCAGNSSTLTEGRTFSCRRPTAFRTRVTTGTSTCPTRRKSRLPTSNIIGSSVRHIFTRIKISTIIFKICYFFPGVLLGISIRTRKPISLNLAPMFWRMLLHRTIGHEDLEAIDLNYSRRQVKEGERYIFLKLKLECYFKWYISCPQYSRHKQPQAELERLRLFRGSLARRRRRQPFSGRQISRDFRVEPRLLRRLGLASAAP